MGRIVDPSEVLLELGLSASVTEEQRAIVIQSIAKAEAAVTRHLRYDPVQAARTEFYPQQPLQTQVQRGVWEAMETRAYMRQVSEAATNELQVQHLPIRSVTSLYRDYDGRSGTATGSFPASSLLTEGVDYWANYDCLDASLAKVCRDGILRSIGLWPTLPGTIKVTYVAGYTVKEFREGGTVSAVPVWETILALAIRKARRVLVTKKGALGVPAGMFTSENLGSYSYSLEGTSAQQLFAGDVSGEEKERLSDYVNWGYQLGS